MKSKKEKRPHQETYPASSDPNANLFNRREALKLIGVGIIITHPVSYSIAGESVISNEGLKNFDVIIDVFRPEDMLILKLAYDNVEFHIRDGNTFLIKKRRNRASYLTVYFPSQHTLEQAFYEANALEDPDNPANENVSVPAKFNRAGQSRLVYQIPDERVNIPLTIPYLLDWQKYKLIVSNRSRVQTPVIAKVNFAGNVKAPVKFKLTKPLKLNQIAEAKPAEREEINEKVILSNPKYINQAELANQPEQIDKILPSESLKLSPDALQDISRRKFYEPMGPVSENHTAIEAPAFLFISPNQLAGFNYSIESQSYKKEADPWPTQDATKKVTNVNPSQVNKAEKEIFELWHARLGVKTNRGINENLLAYKTFRVLWANDAKEDPQADVTRNYPYRASLDQADRHKLVHQTSNFTAGFTPRPVRANKLMLSSLGALLDFWGDLEVENAPSRLNLLLWEHRANLGRDNYVKIVEAGYLFPFGHKASLVKVTERKIDPSSKTAANRQRMYIVVTQPQVTYQPYDKDNKFIPFPFQAVDIITTVTPDIDPFDGQIIGGGNDLKFWVKVSGRRFPFACKAYDKEGNESYFDLPLVFIEKFVADKTSQLNQVAGVYNNTIDTNGGPPVNAPFRGQMVAMAESLAPEDTVFETASVFFNGEVKNQGGEVAFYPTMKDAAVKVKAIAEMTGSNEAVKISLQDDRNKTGLFAKLVQETALDFSGNSDKAGGIFNPNVGITALSKLQGPLGGKPEELADFNFNPQEFFLSNMSSGPVAKLFGVIPIAELLSGVIGSDVVSGAGNATTAIGDIKQQIDYLKAQKQQLIEESAAASAIQQVENEIKNQLGEIENQMNSFMPRIPNLKTYVTAESAVMEYRWKPKLNNSPMTFFNFVTLNVADVNNAVEINARIEKPFNNNPPLAGIESYFNNFDVEILQIIGIGFDQIRFKSGAGQKTDVKVAMKPGGIKFMGPLEFINTLQEVIPVGGFADGPSINLSPTGIKAGYTIDIPAVEAGMLAVKNMSLSANVTLPFTGEPLTFGFQFCKRENPFLLTVSMFGGGGFFGMELSTRGLVMMEASFEFGAAISINLGIASGGVSIMGGFYFQMEQEGDNTMMMLTGYIRLNGALSILGIITLALEFYLALTYLMESGKGDKLIGEATLKVSIEVLFFSKSVSVTARRTLKGANADPVFGDTITEQDWLDYTGAYAVA